ncbi:MAG: cation:proton antiporter [Candidatus Cloacimonetes bacterium]|jgi:multisubunit Na+/H+ antiporter MnhC subunit|nr:cation:proton antiporter [Candidatus Cloacimonadota bacterium]MBT4332777.1 cation:proton antiporter [Candidatus Cloacimonadota bacterium]MBT5421327.1 cation:proton antiporter [Candidatus Cloacimonadota bacterium]
MIIYILCLLLFLVGLYGVIAKRNLIKIIIGIAIMECSINLFFIMIGYVEGGTAPILSKGFENAKFVDPLPQAMILTSIVIGLATTALLLAVAIRLYQKYGTFDIRKIKDLKG